MLQVDIIFDDSYGFGTGNQKDLAGWQQLYGFSSATAASIPAFAGNKVYSFNNRLSGENADGDVGSDWFESAVARPDLVRGREPSVHAVVLQTQNHSCSITIMLPHG